MGGLVTSEYSLQQQQHDDWLGIKVEEGTKAVGTGVSSPMKVGAAWADGMDEHEADVAKDLAPTQAHVAATGKAEDTLEVSGTAAELPAAVEEGGAATDT